MPIDTKILNDYLNVFQIFFSTICVIFLLILLRPLFLFSKERTALFILASKSNANILYQFRQIYVCIYRYFDFSSSYWSYFFIRPSAIILLNAAYFHILALAINRFHAVIFPFSYQRIWKLKKIKYITFILWLFIILWSALQYIVSIKIIDATGFLYYIVYGIIMNGDLSLIITIVISMPLYSVVLLKFIYDYKLNKLGSQNINEQKERIYVLIICLFSLFPCPLLIGMYKLNVYLNTNIKETISIIIFNVLYNACYTLIQCIEEICLLIICEEFRELIKKQYFGNNQNNVVHPEDPQEPFFIRSQQPTQQLQNTNK